jgi:hypothetical protein
MYHRPRLLVVFALCAAAGCSGCRKPPGAGEDTAQGRRLKELYDNGVTIPVEVEGEAPFAFEPIRIDRNEKDGKGFYQAKLAWQYTSNDKPLAEYLKERIQRNTHELNTAFGKVTAFRLHVTYGTGDADDVDVRLGDRSGTVALDKFCATDKPTAVTVWLQSATWFEDEVVTVFLPQRVPGDGRVVGRKLILVAPGDLPIRFDDCLLDTENQDAPRVTWQLVGEPSALARRAAELTEASPRAAGREVKSIRLLLAYRDTFGRPLAEENVLLDLTGRQGTITLAGPRRSEALGSVVVRGVSVTWKERATQVALTK